MFMKTGLIIAIVVGVALLGIIVVMIRAAIRFTDKHTETVLKLRKTRAIVRDLQEDVYFLRKQLADAQAESEKWKTKAVEISINAQKESGER